MSGDGSQSAFAEALLDPERAPPADLRAWNGSDPGRRFAVYRNNVVSALANALADSFPVSCALVGEAFFAATAREFLVRHPPGSPVLAEWGDDFPGFVEGFAPARGVPYLADVARLERLWLAAWHAAEADAIEARAFRELLADVERLPVARLDLHPSAGTLASRFAVMSLWEAHHGVRDIGEVDPFTTQEMLVARPEADVEVTELPAGGAAFVAALGDGIPLGEAAARAATEPGFDLARSLAALLDAGAVTAIRFTGGDDK